MKNKRDRQIENLVNAYIIAGVECYQRTDFSQTAKTNNSI